MGESQCLEETYREKNLACKEGTSGEEEGMRERTAVPRGEPVGPCTHTLGEGQVGTRARPSSSLKPDVEVWGRLLSSDYFNGSRVDWASGHRTVPQSFCSTQDPGICHNLWMGKPGKDRG